MKIPIPQEPSWDCPEGTFEAAVADVRQVTKADKAGKNNDYARLIFEIQIGRKVYRVAKNYPLDLHKGSPLRDDLEDWLGPEIFTLVGHQFDLESLRDMKAVITVRHVNNAGFQKPYVHLAKIAPINQTPVALAA
jgi:hypothetical protein